MDRVVQSVHIREYPILQAGRQSPERVKQFLLAFGKLWGSGFVLDHNVAKVVLYTCQIVNATFKGLA